MAVGGGSTWRHLHRVETGSDERRRGDAMWEGRRWHAHRTRKDRGLERTHTNHWLLHWRNLRTMRYFSCTSQWHSGLRVLSQWYIFTNIILYTSDRQTSLILSCLPVQEEQLLEAQVTLASPPAAVALNGRCGWVPLVGPETSSLQSTLEETKHNSNLDFHIPLKSFVGSHFMPEFVCMMS